MFALLEAENSSWYTVYQCETNMSYCHHVFTPLTACLASPSWVTHLVPRPYACQKLVPALSSTLFKAHSNVLFVFSRLCCQGRHWLTLSDPVKQIAHWGPALEIGRLPSFMHACSSDELVLNFDVPPPPPTWCCGEILRFTQTKY